MKKKAEKSILPKMTITKLKRTIRKTKSKLREESEVPLLPPDLRYSNFIETYKLEANNETQGDLAAIDEAGHEKWKQMSSEKKVDYNKGANIKEFKPKDGPEDIVTLLAPTRTVVQADEGRELPKSPRKKVLETVDLQKFVGTAEVRGVLPKANEVSVVVPEVALLPAKKVINKGKEKIPENRDVSESSNITAKRSRVKARSSTEGLRSKSHCHEISSNQLDLFSRISKWSMSELLSKKPPQQMEPIPVEHDTVESYTEIFSKWMLEESRAHITKNLENVSTLQHQEVHITCHQFSKPGVGLQRVSCRSTTSEKFPARRGMDQRVLAVSDVVLVSSFRPRISPKALEKEGNFLSLGIVHGHCHSVSQSSFDVVIREGPLYKKALQEKIVWYVVKLVPLVTFQRIWDSLHQPQTTPMMEMVATYKRCDFKNQSPAPAKTPPLDEATELKLQKYCNSVSLNVSQSEAVKAFVHRQQPPMHPMAQQEDYNKTERCSVGLIQGPPGTGKTSTLIAMLSPTVCTSTRIVVCAPTNTAAHEAARRFLQKMEHDLGAVPPITHFCGDSPSAGTCLPIRRGDIVLVGRSKQRHPVEKGNPLDKIFLPSRVKRLVKALDAYTGWESLCKELLRDISFRLVKRHGAQIIEHGEALCHDLPTHHLSTRAMEGIQAILASVRRILSLLTNSDGDCTAPSTARQEFSVLLKHLRGRSPGFIYPTDLQEWVEEKCVASASLVFCTVSAAAHKSMKLGAQFSSQTVIVDEAGQLVEAESSIVLQMQEVKQLVLIGDHKQLQATVQSQLAKENYYARSLFERLEALGHPCKLLNVQYRMHPRISYFPRMKFYNGQVTDGDNVADHEHGYQKIFGQIAFIDVADGQDFNNGLSKRNCAEADYVIDLLKRLNDSVCADFGNISQPFRRAVTVGVLCPYSGQVEDIKNRLNFYSGSIYDSEFLDVEVNSIDGFQGRETDVVIFSAVRANATGKIGFLEEQRRVNVALTRGRHALWILGSAETLVNSSDLWSDLIEDARTWSYCFSTTQFGLKRISF